MQQKIRLMIVDDSLLFRSWLMQNLGADPRFEIVGYAINARDAESKLALLKPDIMTLDIEMPGMSGLDFLKKVLPSHPVPCYFSVLSKCTGIRRLSSRSY